MLPIIYKDDFIVAINKPNGMLVHRTAIAADAKVFVLQELRNQLGGQKVYPVHRLDRKTSGVLLFGLTSAVVAKLQECLTNKTAQKRYLALVRGWFPETITVDYALTNDRGKRQEAITQFRCLEQTEVSIPLGKHITSRYSLIEAFPQTGRQHQIRKHLNHLRHPIIGDRPHGCNKQNRLFLQRWNMKNMLLHAVSLDIPHPEFAKQLQLHAPLPVVFQDTLKRLDFKTDGAVKEE